MSQLLLSFLTLIIGEFQLLNRAPILIKVRSTGIIGTTAVMTALLRRAEEGGSFTIDVR